VVSYGVWSSGWVRNGMRVVALGLVVLLAWRLHELWRDSPASLSRAEPGLLILAAIASLVAVVAYGAVWPIVLRRIGAPVPHDATRIFLQSQLGKYVPGSVWQYAGRVALAKARGLGARLTMLSLGIEVGASGVAAVAVGLFVLPWWLAVPLAAVVAAAAVGLSHGRVGGGIAAAISRGVRRVVPLGSEDLAVARRATPSVAVLYIPVWVAYGVAFWLTARAFYAIPATDGLYFTATFALGWLVGMVAVFAPGGIGVREAVLAGLLGPRVGHTEALVIAGMSRIFLTGADLAAGGTALLLARFNRPNMETAVDGRS